MFPELVAPVKVIDYYFFFSPSPTSSVRQRRGERSRWPWGVWVPADNAAKSRLTTLGENGEKAAAPGRRRPRQDGRQRRHKREQSGSDGRWRGDALHSVTPPRVLSPLLRDVLRQQTGVPPVLPPHLFNGWLYNGIIGNSSDAKLSYNIFFLGISTSSKLITFRFNFSLLSWRGNCASQSGCVSSFRPLPPLNKKMFVQPFFFFP